ncbi:hypothetical protein ACFE04_014671 [Oxalis oulophora]
MTTLRNSPKLYQGSPWKKTLTLQHLFDLDSTNMTSPKNVLSKLSSSSSSENEDILSLITHCSVIFSFTNNLESPSQQDFKTLKLTHILSIVKSHNNNKTILRDTDVLSSLFTMLSFNLFRPLPPPSNWIPGDFPNDEDFASNPSPLWPHLQIIYEILLWIIINIDPDILRNHVNNQFLLNLLALFQSEDPRERDCLKNIYHRIYSKCTIYRFFMRKSMKDVFLHYVFNCERHCGIGELLEIWGSIINGFTVPLKEEHKLFLMRILIPLHKRKGVQVYHRQLAYCVAQFVHKEPVLGGIIVRGILRYWPVSNCQKEVLFIGELEELVENIDPDQYRKLALPLCSQITRCLNSCNSQVAERALYIWNNEQFVKMASSAMEQVFLVLVEGMEKNLKWHWSNSVKQLTQNVKLMFQEMDPDLYQNCLREIKLKDSIAQNEEITRKIKWERIEFAAANNNNNYSSHFLKPQQYIYV